MENKKEITSRIRNNEKELSFLYPKILKSLQEGLSITDLDENIIYCNKAAQPEPRPMVMPLRWSRPTTKL